jgi:hypothetical protein
MMFYPTIKHSLFNDTYTEEMLRAAKYMLETTRFFRAVSGSGTTPRSIYYLPEQFAMWEQSRGTSKSFVKWLAPLFTNATPKNTAAVIFGKDPSPIQMLGDRSVRAYIRHLLYGQGWSIEAVSQHLVDQHGYQYTSARPMIRRIVREEEASGKSSAYYKDNDEQSLFPEGVIQPQA